MLTDSIVLGGGCFWCTEAVFRLLEGVEEVVPGYAGGLTRDPTYRKVCSGRTGHAEVVRVEYDPGRIALEELLEVFFGTHDPTSLNRQGNDVGTQYRSVVLYSTEEQKKTVEEYIETIRGDYENPLVTEVKELDVFYPAEEYHHRYFEKHPYKPYCRLVISPKVSKASKKLAGA